MTPAGVNFGTATFDEMRFNGRSNGRIVEVYVRRLSVKIGPEPDHPVHLKTRRGIAYVFHVPADSAS